MIQDNFAEYEADDVENLARAYVRNESDAVENVKEILTRLGFVTAVYPLLERKWDKARKEAAAVLAQQYAREEPAAVTLIHELLANAGMNMDDFVLDALAQQLKYGEQIDRLITFAESRRNASLREIDRRHALFGEKLRQSVQEIEGEFDVIEATPAKGKDAA
jgi:hypothetical protein